MNPTALIQQQQAKPQSAPPLDNWRNRAIAYAVAEFGKPYSGPVIGEPESYRWGSPGWDCSSFVSGMIKKATAVELTAFTDAAYDQLVPTSSPQPADVVFYRYDDPAQPGVRFPHMGLWLSDTEVLDARYPQGVGRHPHVGGVAREVRTLPGAASSVWIPPEQDSDYRGFLYREAPRRGMDPDICALVISHEGGLSEPARLGDFSGPPWYSGKSWWALQLHYGGEGTPYEAWGGSAGMGNGFSAFTGWAAGDPAAWRDAMRYGLDGARREGWYAWYGAAAEGIRGFMGIDRSIPWSGTPATEWDFRHV